MFRPRRHNSNSEQGHGGLLITPLLDLLVSLIPILILGVVLTRINVVDVAVSKPVTTMQNTPAKNFELTLKISNSSYDLQLNGKTRHTFSREDKTALDRLHAELVAIKKDFPQEFEIKVEPENGTLLNNIMEIIDASREVKAGDPAMTRKDEATGKDVKIRYLFPHVILRGVYG